MESFCRAPVAPIGMRKFLGLLPVSSLCGDDGTSLDSVGSEPVLALVVLYMEGLLREGSGELLRERCSAVDTDGCKESLRPKALGNEEVEVEKEGFCSGEESAGEM